MAIKPIQILINAKDNASGVFSSLQAKIVGVGVAIAGYFGIDAFAGAVKGAAELEAKMSEVAAISGATADELVAMRNAAEQAGATTQFTATEAAEALGNLARAGLSAGESVTALTPTLQLAQAGGIGLAESSEIVTKSLSGFGFAAEEAGRVADVLAKGANASNTSVTGLGQALSYAAPTAVSLGLSLEETVAIIGKFADAGIDASRAGTALNSILAQFSNPASLFRKELAAAGITTNDFGQALRELEARGPAGSKAILAVGQEAGPALRSLLNQGIGALDELTGKLNEAKGSAAETAAVMQNNLQGAAKGLSSAWDTVKNALATPVLPVLKEGVDQLASALRTAVSDGTVGKFGDAIANAFQGAITWAKAFIAEVDFSALAAKISSAADQVGDAFTRLSTYANNTGNTVKLVWGVMAAGANSVLTGIYALGTAFAATASSIVKGAAIASEALAKIAITDTAKKKLLDDAAAMREVLVGLGGVTAEFAAKANQSLDDVAGAAQAAREGWAGLTSATEEAGDKAKTSASVMEQVGSTLREVGGDAEALGMKAKASAVLQTEAARAVRVEVDALKKQYEQALQAGNVQLALTKLQQMRDALKTTAGQAQTTAEDIKAAFTAAGISTQKELDETAAKTRKTYEVIKASGQATAQGLALVWKQAADAAIAAADGVAPSWVSAAAEAQGYRLEIDAAGKAVLNLKAATDSAGDSANKAAGGYRNMAKSAAQAAASAKELENVNRRYSKPGESSTQQGNESNYDPGRNPYGRAGQNDQPRNGNGQTQAEFQRSEKLAGQGASDETLRFALLEKLNKGTLSEGDLSDLKNVVATLRENQKMFDSLGIGTADVSTLRDDQKWQAIQTRFQQAIDKFQGQSGALPTGAAGVGRTVRFELALNNKEYGAATVDESGAANMENFLDALRKGRGTAQ